MDDDQTNPECKDKVIDRYRQLVDEGSYEVGVSPEIDPNVPPPWYDKDKFKQAQSTAAKFFPSLSYASFSGLLIGIQIPLFLEPLLLTGTHETIPKLFRRYLDTVLKVHTWYADDPFEEGSKSYKSLRQVRRMHNHVTKMMNDRTERVQGKDKIWVSQCQMAMTQAGFFGLLVLVPGKCFAHGISDTELEDIIYLWRVLGYLNGIKDKYNLCSGNLEETRVYLKYIFTSFVIPQIIQKPNHPYPIGFEVAKGIANSLRPIRPAIRWQTILYYWYEILNIPFPYKLSIGHRLLLAFSKFSFTVLFRFRFMYNLFNRTLKRRVHRAERLKENIESDLAAKYPDSKYSAGCPYKLTLDWVSSKPITPSDVLPDVIPDINDNDTRLNVKSQSN